MPRFVLLEHLWDGVHWDLMLERGEVLRTWAIDAPVVAGEDLPARALPDHRRIYLDYQGAINAFTEALRLIPGDQAAQAHLKDAQQKRDEAAAVIEVTRSVAERFYGGDELAVERARVA